MPIEIVGFTADHRIVGSIPLADDRMTDMLNAVSRVVVRGASVESLLYDTPQESSNVTVACPDFVLVVIGGPRGLESKRRRTRTMLVRMTVDRYVVHGFLHIPLPGPGEPVALGSDDPVAALSGRDLLVPLTGASIRYDRAGKACEEQHEVVLVNRARIDSVQALPDPATMTPEERATLEVDNDAPVRRWAKDFTGSVAD
jgi:hypothetical protein